MIAVRFRWYSTHRNVSWVPGIADVQKRVFFLWGRTGCNFEFIPDEPHPYWTLGLDCLPARSLGTTYLTSPRQCFYLSHEVYNCLLLVKVKWDQGAWHIVSAQNPCFFHLWLLSIWNTVPLSLLRFLTSLVCSCVQTALAEGKAFFLNRLFHNLLAQICCCCTVCFSGSLGPPVISMYLASHLNDPGKWLPWVMLLNAEWIFLPALWLFGMKLAQGF